MEFSHHNMVGVDLAVALTNLAGTPRDTHDIHGVRDGELDSRQVDTANAADAAVWAEALAEHGIDRITLDPPTLHQLVSLAHDLRVVFAATTTAASYQAVNALLAAGGPAYIADHDDLPPHLHFAPDTDRLLSRVRGFTAGSLAMFLVETGGQRLGQCEHTGCSTVFADTSRGGHRRYCSTRCANLDAVARHRLKQRRY